MTHVKEGKTKSIYLLEDGNYLLKFKDDATGEDGVFDPGSNAVGLTIDGMGKGGLRLTEYFFKAIAEQGIPTHFVSADIEKAEMTVRPAARYGEGLEVICRRRAVGSFLRRYGDYVYDGQKLDNLVEITLKSDERGDPPITRETLVMLDILSGEEYDLLHNLTVRITNIVSDLLAQKGIELYDIKFEFGRVDNTVALIDEISAGNMRAYKDGCIVAPLELVKLVLE